MTTGELSTKPLHRRSAFYPTIGTILLLVASGLRGALPWLDVAAESLVVVAFFLGATRSKSVAAKDVVDVVNSNTLPNSLPRADDWRGNSR